MRKCAGSKQFKTRGGGSQRNARRCAGGTRGEVAASSLLTERTGGQRRGLLSERPLDGGPSRSHRGRAKRTPALLTPLAGREPVTRFERGRLTLLGSNCGDDREVLWAHLRWIELADVRGHASQELGHRHRRLLSLFGGNPADWIAARHHDLTQVWTLHAALLERLHVCGDAVIDVEKTHGPLLALA